MTALKSLFIISGHLCNHCKNNEFSLTFLNEWLIGEPLPAGDFDLESIFKG